jgi:uncharacterized Tic20 family protein
MINSLLRHNFRTTTLLQVLIDFGLVFEGVFIAVMWVGGSLPIDFPVLTAYAAILALTMLALNNWLGFYQRIHDRTVDDSRARAVLALHLSVPIAYLLFLILPIADADRTFLELSGMAA